MKKRFCLFRFFSQLLPFVELKRMKTSSVVKKNSFVQVVFLQMARSRSSRIWKCGIWHAGYIHKLIREIKMLQSGSQIQHVKLLHTKYQVNPSILRGYMPKKIFRPQNLGINSLTLPAVRILSIKKKLKKIMKSQI